MNQVKASGGSGRATPVEDPVLIRQAMQDLRTHEVEFPIKVEGTHTLPYTARVLRVDEGKGLIHLKLIRPLPHELAVGAAFEMLFSLMELRFEAPTVFQGREDYLLYRFSIPIRLQPSDRRVAKRYPFRPREKAYVIAQDGGVPGHGLSGPLVNLSVGGLAFRVDRVMRLDDHMRITPGLGFFERGKALPMLKIRDLPNLPVFDARGTLANACERDGEFIIGVQFGELRESEFKEILDVLAIRENMQRAATVSSGEIRRDAGSRGSRENKGPAARISPAGTQTPDALHRLGRRCTRIILAMEPGAGREQIQQAFSSAGFLRMEAVDTLDRALAEVRAERSAACPLLVLESGPAKDRAISAIQSLQKDLGETRELTAALLVREEPLPPTEDPLIRPVPWPDAANTAWLPILDELAGLEYNA
ncbi:MAG: PilZ domain-containing protein [Acidobacteria bacterium]|nr:PilZ domain-containing protein [Acidobacteriota bacterium]MBI3487297.1 PilZ domain-containing protein [Acidobacteriota bacterium]